MYKGDGGGGGKISGAEGGGDVGGGYMGIGEAGDGMMGGGGGGYDGGCSGGSVGELSGSGGQAQQSEEASLVSLQWKGASEQTVASVCEIPLPRLFVLH